MLCTTLGTLIAITPTLVANGSGHDRAVEAESWHSFDREVARLSATPGTSLVRGRSTYEINAMIRTSAASSDDIMVGAGDFGGFLLESVRFQLRGTVDDFEYFIQTESAPGASALLDAQVSHQAHEHVRVTAGQFRLPFLWSSLVNIDDLVMIGRTAAGSTNVLRDIGVMFDGGWDRFHWYAAVHDAADGPADSLGITARATMDVLGEGARMVEGAYGAPDEAQLTLGIATQVVEDSASDGDAAAIDLVYANGPWATHMEWVHNRNRPMVLGNQANATNFGVTVSHRFHEDWEAAIRYETLNDRDVLGGSGVDIDTHGVILGLNRYFEGHDAKLQLNISDVSADAPGSDTQIFAIGLTVAF